MIRHNKTLVDIKNTMWWILLKYRRAAYTENVKYEALRMRDPIPVLADMNFGTSRRHCTFLERAADKCLHSPLHCNCIKLLYEMMTCMKLTCILQLQAVRTRACTSWTLSAMRSHAWTSCKATPVQCLALASTTTSLCWLPAIIKV